MSFNGNRFSFLITPELSTTSQGHCRISSCFIFWITATKYANLRKYCTWWIACLSWRFCFNFVISAGFLFLFIFYKIIFKTKYNRKESIKNSKIIKLHRSMHQYNSKNYYNKRVRQNIRKDIWKHHIAVGREKTNFN